MNQQQFAAVVGLSQPAVSGLFSRGIITGEDWRAWIRDYCKHLREMAAGRKGDDGGELDLVRERARLAKAQADAVEMKNAQDRRELIRVEEVEPRLKTAFRFAQTRFLDSATRLARELPADYDARLAMLNDALSEFLATLADWAKEEAQEE